MAAVYFNFQFRLKAFSLSLFFLNRKEYDIYKLWKTSLKQVIHHVLFYVVASLKNLSVSFPTPSQLQAGIRIILTCL